jgi:hypothetical protein
VVYVEKMARAESALAVVVVAFAALALVVVNGKFKNANGSSRIAAFSRKIPAGGFGLAALGAFFVAGGVAMLSLESPP